MDDDIVLPSSALVKLLEVASEAELFGFIAPSCQHTAYPTGYSSETHSTSQALCSARTSCFAIS